MQTLVSSMVTLYGGVVDLTDFRHAGRLDWFVVLKSEENLSSGIAVKLSVAVLLQSV